MTDGSGLAGVTAALDINLDVELIQSLGCAEGLANDNLKGLKAKVLVDICLVDGDLAGAGSQVNSRYRSLPSAGSIILCISQCLILPID